MKTSSSSFRQRIYEPTPNVDFGSSRDRDTMVMPRMQHQGDPRPTQPPIPADRVKQQKAA